jgi:ABC-type polysaccharide/polyol phosphate export permease
MIWVILLTILQGICGMAFGLVVSALCDNEQDAIQLALGSFYPNLLLSGIIWPLEGMPEQLRYTGGPHEESYFLFLIYDIK